MIQPYRPIAYSLMKCHEGSSSGLRRCSIASRSTNVAAPANDRRAAVDETTLTGLAVSLTSPIGYSPYLFIVRAGPGWGRPPRPCSRSIRSHRHWPPDDSSPSSQPGQVMEWYPKGGTEAFTLCPGDFTYQPLWYFMSSRLAPRRLSRICREIDSGHVFEHS